MKQRRRRFLFRRHMPIVRFPSGKDTVWQVGLSIPINQERTMKIASRIRISSFLSISALLLGGCQSAERLLYVKRDPRAVADTEVRMAAPEE